MKTKEYYEAMDFFIEYPTGASSFTNNEWISRWCDNFEECYQHFLWKPYEYK